jgi:hypothetical protein
MSRPSLSISVRDEGEVSKIFRKQQYGFLTTPEGQDVFFMLKDADSAIYIGDKVTFVSVVDQSHTGKVKGVSVTKVGNEPAPICYTPGGSLLSPRVRDMARKAATRRKSVLSGEVDPSNQATDPDGRIAQLERELAALKSSQQPASQPMPASLGRPSLAALPTNLDDAGPAGLLSPRVRLIAAKAASRRASTEGGTPRDGVAGTVPGPPASSPALSAGSAGGLTPRVMEAARARKDAKQKELEDMVANFDETSSHEGEVVQIVRGKFGFIMMDTIKIFFHLSDVVPPPNSPEIEVRIKCKVRFFAKADPWNKGKLKARDVCVIAPAPRDLRAGTLDNRMRDEAQMMEPRMDPRRAAAERHFQAKASREGGGQGGGQEGGQQDARGGARQDFRGGQDGRGGQDFRGSGGFSLTGQHDDRRRDMRGGQRDMRDGDSEERRRQQGRDGRGQRRQSRDEDWQSFLKSRNPTAPVLAGGGAVGGWRSRQRAGGADGGAPGGGGGGALSGIRGNTRLTTNVVMAKGPPQPGATGFRMERSVPSAFVPGDASDSRVHGFSM